MRGECGRCEEESVCVVSVGGVRRRVCVVSVGGVRRRVCER